MNMIRNLAKSDSRVRQERTEMPCPEKTDEKAIIMSGYGINSEMETQEAFTRAGMSSDIVHINDLIAGRKKLSDYRLLVFPGGFSYGDDTGAGNAYANRVRNNLWGDVEKFLDSDNLVLGICNGFQILANLGLVPAFDKRYEREIALMPNRKRCTGMSFCHAETCIRQSMDPVVSNKSTARSPMGREIFSV